MNKVKKILNYNINAKQGLFIYLVCFFAIFSMTEILMITDRYCERNKCYEVYRVDGEDILVKIDEEKIINFKESQFKEKYNVGDSICLKEKDGNYEYTIFNKKNSNTIASIVTIVYVSIIMVASTVFAVKKLN